MTDPGSLIPLTSTKELDRSSRFHFNTRDVLGIKYYFHTCKELCPYVWRQRHHKSCAAEGSTTKIAPSVANTFIKSMNAAEAALRWSIKAK